MWKRFSSSFAELHHPPSSIISDIPSSIQIKPMNPAPNLSFRRNNLDCFKWMLSVAPCFPVNADKVSIITEPSNFYDTLVDKCNNATHRITLASLYLGTGHLEKRLVSTIHDKLRDNVRVNVLLDFQRGTRGQLNSAKMLLPLLENFNKNCRISLYHTPHLRGISKRLIPPRWNEIIELQHMKVYLIDNTVILSGANLSNDYFTNRQDRYIMIEDKDLANFYANLVTTVQGFSLELEANGSVQKNSDCPSPYEDSREKFVTFAKNKLVTFYQNALNTQINKGQNNIGKQLFRFVYFYSHNSFSNQE